MALTLTTRMYVNYGLGQPAGLGETGCNMWVDWFFGCDVPCLCNWFVSCVASIVSVILDWLMSGRRYWLLAFYGITRLGTILLVPYHTSNACANLRHGGLQSVPGKKPA